MRAAALAVLLTFAATPSWPEAPTLVVHVSHDPRQEVAADLRAALEKACVLPPMKCRIAPALEATTFLHVFVQEVHVQPAPPTGKMFTGLMDIKSRVMMPGSVSAQAASIERLALSLLTAVKVRQAERAGVVVVPSGEFGR